TASPERIRAAMRVIPNPDLGWDDFKKLGLATWRATGGSDEGFAIWDEWSRKSSKHNADNTRREWDRITRSPPSRIGAGTIFFLANQQSARGGAGNAAAAEAQDADAVVLPAGAPLAAAEEYVKRYESEGEVALLRAYRGAFYRWTGSHWREYPDEKLAADL